MSTIKITLIYELIYVSYGLPRHQITKLIILSVVGNAQVVYIGKYILNCFY